MYSEDELAQLAEGLSEEELIQALAEHEAEDYGARAEEQFARLQRDLGRSLTSKEQARAEEVIVRQFEDGKEPDAVAAFYNSLPDPKKAAEMWAVHTVTGRAPDPVDMDDRNQRVEFINERVQDAARAEQEAKAEQPEPELPLEATDAERRQFMGHKLTGDTGAVERLIDVIHRRDTDPNAAGE